MVHIQNTDTSTEQQKNGYFSWNGKKSNLKMTLKR